MMSKPMRKGLAAGAVALGLLGGGVTAHADDYASVMNQGCPCTRWRHFSLTVPAGEVRTWSWYNIRGYAPGEGHDWYLQAHVVVRSGDTVDVTDTNDDEGNGLDWGQTNDVWLTDQMWATDVNARGYPLDNFSLTFDNSQVASPDQSESDDQLLGYRLPLADDQLLADDLMLSGETIDVTYRFAQEDCCSGNAGPYEDGSSGNS
jgi:hypothetical protein